MATEAAKTVIERTDISKPKQRRDVSDREGFWHEERRLGHEDARIRHEERRLEHDDERIREEERRRFEHHFFRAESM